MRGAGPPVRQPERGQRVQRRLHQRGPAVPPDGARRGGNAAGSFGERRAASLGGSGFVPHPDLRRAVGGSRGGDPAPRCEAGEHPAHHRRQATARRLRDRVAAGRHRGDVDPHHSEHAPHGPRDVRESARRALGPVLPGVDIVRPDRGSGPVLAAHRPVGPSADEPAAQRSCAVDAARLSAPGVERSRATNPGEGPPAATTDRRRLRGGAPSDPRRRWRSGRRGDRHPGCVRPSPERRRPLATAGATRQLLHPADAGRPGEPGARRYRPDRHTSSSRRTVASCGLPRPGRHRR